MKKLKVFQRKKVCRAFRRTAAAVLLFGLAGACTMKASAEEGQNVTYIYHQHTGCESEGGGCYQTPIYHEHIGNEEEGGSCYETPVYHVHTGDEQSGGACYGTPVLHEHAGDSNLGGGCYRPVYHSHNSSCYVTISSQEYGCYVVKTVNTTYDDYEGHDFKDYYMSCGEVVHGDNSAHSHTVSACGKENVIEGYALGCGKTEQSVDGYLFDCEKEEGETIDAYRLSCEKNSADIDRYELSCQQDEKTVLGKIAIRETVDGSKKKTTLTAEFEDLSGGALQLADSPFTWQDGNGNVIGDGRSITVSENGKYSVTLSVVNEDVKKDSLRAEISISSIVKPIQSDSGNENGSGDGSHDGEADIGGSGETEASILESPSPLPSETPFTVLTDAEGSGIRNAEGRSSLKRSVEASAAPSASPELKKQVQTIKIPERKSQNTDVPEIETAQQINGEGQKSSFFSSPAGKLITVTAGALFGMAGLVTFLYFLRMSVRVYNDDGRGKMTFLGICRVKLTDEGYMIDISDAMAERAVTNRYCIKPGAFRFFRGEGEELLVCRKKRSISVCLDKEMIVVI